MVRQRETRLPSVNTLQKLLYNKTHCALQYKGFPCNTDFHVMELGVSPKKLHDYWEAVLLYRGDYTPKEIPIGKKEMEKRIKELVTRLKR